VAFEIFEHAPVRGTPLEAGAKALVVRAEDRFVHCVLPAHLKADNARLRALVGTRTLRFATPDELLTVTGCAPGAVPPFGEHHGLDHDALRGPRPAGGCYRLPLRGDERLKRRGAGPRGPAPLPLGAAFL